MSDGEIKKYIKNSIKVITKRLNLKIPHIEFSEFWGIGYSAYFELINIYLEDLKEECKYWDNNLCPLKINNFQDQVYFVIAHEVGHHFQYTKFPEWFRKYREKKRNTLWKTREEYSKIKLEKNATKIACILFKEYKRKEVI